MSSPAEPANALGPIDITLVTSRRPDLLQATLRSFWTNALKRFQINRLIVNIDPIWGDAEDDAAVERICRSYPVTVCLRRPEAPSFGAAVKWLWGQVETPWFLHLEDDWDLVRPISTKALAAEATNPTVGQICFHHREKKWSRWRKGIWLPQFSTSPSLVRGEFGLLASSLMDPAFDPEKQFHQNINPALASGVRSYRARFHGHRFSRKFLIVDTGRAWRANRGIEKRVIEGRSEWSKS